jgi:hypothetical protein
MASTTSGVLRCPKGLETPMPSYGFLLSQVQVRRRAMKGEPLRLGTLQPPDDLSDSGLDALRIIYGIMRGLRGYRIDESGTNARRHFTVASAEGVGRCVKFTANLGKSGQDSTINDPEAGAEADPFVRSRRHIETLNEPRRGLLLLPDRSTAGLLVVEAHGRSSWRDILTAELKRLFRQNTEQLVLDVNSVVDAAALARYLEEAKVNRLILRRYKLPRDFAGGLEMGAEEDDTFSMKTEIEGPFRRVILNRLQENSAARRQLLVMNEMNYDELNVQVQVGDRRVTISVVGDRAPSIINVISGTRPSDAAFYRAVTDMIAEIAPGVGVNLGDGWATSPWSDAGRAFIIERRPADSEEDPDDAENGDQ